MDKPVIIVNPRSGGGIGQSQWARLVGPITDGVGPFDLRFTEAAGHAVVIARDEAKAGRSMVVALGGDGTISEVVNGLMQSGNATRTELAIIPRGTGGDFRRTLGLEKNVAHAAAQIAKSTSRLIDVGRAHVTGPDGKSVERFFINVASFGFSAAVADRANRSSKRLGARVAFMGATLRTLFSHDAVDVTFTPDDREPVRRRLLLGAIGNGRYFGGGMKICPDARLDDGLFDAVWVGDLGRAEVLLKSNRLYDGTHVDLPEVTHERIRRVHVQPMADAPTVPVELDGETDGVGCLPATFEVVAGALRLRG